MCDEIKIEKDLNEQNNIIARINSDELRKNRIYTINVMGSPGSGKTTIIENIAKQIQPKDILVIQGDLESDVDKLRLEKAGIDVHQINTHSGCHLNSHMIKHTLEHMNLDSKKFLFIENVGNLVCPAGVELGQEMNIVVSSTSEGHDKPQKYPIIFHDAHILIISKTDMASVAGFDKDKYVNSFKRINNSAKIIETSKDNETSFKEIAKILIKERDKIYS